MMKVKKQAITALVMGAIISCSPSAYAAFIVNTGSAPSYSAAFSLDDRQYMAAEFNLDFDAKITTAFGHITSPGVGGEGTLALYADGGEIPGEELYSATFSTTGYSTAWQGRDDLSWILPTGIYWISFESRDQGLNANMRYQVPRPLPNAASWSSSSGWKRASHGSSVGIGVAILASPVPIPTAAWLFGSGLLGLVAMSRRKKSV